MTATPQELEARIQALEAKGDPPGDKKDKPEKSSVEADISALKDQVAALKADADDKTKLHEEAGITAKSEAVALAAATGALSAGVVGATLAWSPIKIEAKPLLRFEPQLFSTNKDLTSRYDNWRARRSGGRFITESLQSERRLEAIELKIGLHANRLVRLEKFTNKAARGLTSAHHRAARLETRTGDLESGAIGAGQSIQRLRTEVDRLASRIG
ncbi:hypothetical protein LMJ38_07735 [Streptomyces sp. R1]|uniref:hypothetical protein n=1 Tax=Streptomyces TaxID=1883 RepID=UPI00052B06FD|nr:MULTISPECIES: hypothetical protein [unclassified Streptomyces]AIV34774.1 hypothetical protein NI25_15700 [Streptomyces sp. CCM_MD2014]MCC8335827.1 hypothetical protein [Streptomyces sp. R1]MDA4886284.1 hypothetical protein [Streptomyces sp. MS2A]MYS50001.1 hypothetical protein [Streptomyces sp. SID6013]